MKKILNLISENKIIVFAVLIAIFIELLAITHTACFPFLTNPFYTILIISSIIILILLIPNKKIKLAITTIFLFIQTILDTMFIFLFDSNGTVFEWAMYNQRTDAAGTLETFDLEYGFMILCFAIIIIYAIIMFINIKKSDNKKIILSKKKKRNCIILEIILLLTIILIPTLETTNKDTYINKLYSASSNNYQRIGIIANGVYQLIKGTPSVDIKNLDDVDEFIYEEPILTSKYNGISKDNNLILILVESFEWYPFTLYPDVTKNLYPNISRLINNGLYASNYYEKEKTDVSEALSVLGNYPTGQYINYDFDKNKYPFSLPNLLKNNNPNMVVNSFHANYGEFYNRYNLHQSWGFSRLYGIDEMKEYGVVDTWNHKAGERNLDSITFEKTKELMFPTKEQFFSFILSFSMHGYYAERESLTDYYKILDDNNVIKNTDNINDEYLKTYMAALMDFDKAMGIMLDYLEDNNILDTSTIILYSDHNTYYNKLSNYVKDIDEKYNSDLFNLPFLIYDEKLTKAYKEDNNTNEISKFITASDIVPTVLDMFKVGGWKNLYFGNSVLVPNVESIVYSRNYGFFMTDKFIGYSLKNPIYKSKDLTKEDLKSFEERALIHLKKLEYVDKIYYSNYFKNHKYKEN